MYLLLIKHQDFSLLSSHMKLNISNFYSYNNSQNVLVQQVHRHPTPKKKKRLNPINFDIFNVDTGRAYLPTQRTNEQRYQIHQLKLKMMRAGITPEMMVNMMKADPELADRLGNDLLGTLGRTARAKAKVWDGTERGISDWGWRMRSMKGIIYGKLVWKEEELRSLGLWTGPDKYRNRQ